MADCPDCGSDHDDLFEQYKAIEEVPGGGMMVPMHVYGGGLDDDARTQLERILEAIDRSQLVSMEMAKTGNPLSEWEGLHRVVMAVSDSALVPILKLIMDGNNPAVAMKAVFAGLGAMMFIAGTYYEKEMALPDGDRRPIQPQREKLLDPTAEELQAQKDLFARLALDNDEQDN